MDTSTLFDFINKHALAVISTVSLKQVPESAVIGVAVNEQLEIIFDTTTTSRKHRNLQFNPNVALVIGWDNETTVQYEGRAQQLTGEELEQAKAVYFTKFPDGTIREQWPDIAYYIIRPSWIRYSDFNTDPPLIAETTL